MSASQSSKSLLRDALISTTSAPKGPPVVDGILSITPDTPEVVEWRRSALDITETSSTYLEDEDDVGPRPNELFGKFTWKIENFSEISKRELRSNVFDVGSYKWYILVYPQGCDVCNHLSLFLCVADYDKLLPGWSHFAQFTIAVVNKDPKKSKYSDTLHRFCKKEHDWGWKKFMELSKVLDGFTVADTLVIKAQVQVILDKPSKPFRCLDPQYRRELVRVYLTNVEGVCRRFCDEKRARLMWVKEEADKFREFWLSLSHEQQRKLLVDKADTILKALVKQFFNEKEVTSTLVMDALFSGCKQIEEHSSLYVQNKSPEGPPLVLIRAERNTFQLLGDLLELADRVGKDFIPAAKDDKMMQPADGLALRSGHEDDYRRDSIESDEKRLAELGRKTVEMLVISHIITEKMEAAYRDAEALKRQDQLIAEEFELQKLEEVRAKAQAEKEKEKKAKKKEKMRAKKEMERAKKEAEDAERKRQDEARRLEQERKAAEAAAADRKKHEEEQALRAKQQVQARQAAQQHAAQQQQAQQRAANAKAAAQAQQTGKGGKTATASGHGQAAAASSQPSAAQRDQQRGSPQLSTSVPTPDPTESAQQLPASRPLTGQLSSDTTGDGLSTSSSSSVSSGRGQDDGDSAASKEVGTVDQATGAARGTDSEDDMRSGRADSLVEDEAQAAAASRDRVRAAELESEVRRLKSRVLALEQQLTERDAEVLSLKSQLADVASRSQASSASLAGAAKQDVQASASAPVATSAASAAPAPPAAAPAPLLSQHLPAGAATGANPRASSESDLPQGSSGAASAVAKAGAELSDRAAISGTTGLDATTLGGLGAIPPPPPPSGPANRRGGSMNPYDMPNAQARGAPHMNGMPQQGARMPGAAGGGHGRGAGSAGDATGQQMAAAAAAAAPSAEQAGGLRSAQPYGNTNNLTQGGAAGGRPDGAKAAGAGTADAPSVASYRNAAAGGLGLAAGSASVAAPLHPVHPVCAGTPAGADAAAVAVTTPSKLKTASEEPSTPNTTPLQPQHSAGAGSVTVTPHMQRHLNHAAAEFTSGSRLMMQQQAASLASAQTPGLAFGSKRPQQQSQQQQAQMDSPGLDDFAHMGLIDDLLRTE